MTHLFVTVTQDTQARSRQKSCNTAKMSTYTWAGQFCRKQLIPLWSSSPSHFPPCPLLLHGSSKLKEFIKQNLFFDDNSFFHFMCKKAAWILLLLSKTRQKMQKSQKIQTLHNDLPQGYEALSFPEYNVFLCE